MRSPALSRRPAPTPKVAIGRTGRGVSLDRLRRMRGLQGRRGKSLRAPRHLGIQVDGGFASHVLVPHPRYLIDYARLSPSFAGA